MFEFFMNQLRLHEPAPKSRFVEYTGLDLAQADAAMHKAVSQGLLENHADYWQTTPRGRLYLNAILAEFLDDE